MDNSPTKPEEGVLVMTKDEFINRQLDLTNRAVQALEHIAARDEMHTQAINQMQSAIAQNSEAIAQNTSTFRVLQATVSKDAEYGKPILRILLYIFVVFAFALIIIAGVEEALKIPLNIPGL